MKKKVDMTSKRLAEILTQHGIDRELWPAWKALVFYGKRPSEVLNDEVLTYRFWHGRAYKRCFNAIVTEISEAYWKEQGVRFPPPQDPNRRKAS